MQTGPSQSAYVILFKVIRILFFFSRDGEIVALKEDVNIIKNIISLVLYHLLSRYFPVVQTNLRKSIFDTFYMYLSQPSVVDHPINKLQLCP